jgi:alpha-ribazole phosphatase/probable phosphoglycerate mutase
MSVSIVYETHATTTDNEAGIATGWLPGELSETGRRQAAELGKRRRNDGIAAVFSSDLKRAVETAEIAFEGSSIPLLQDRRLRECNYGDLNGVRVSTIIAPRERRIDAPFPGGQSYRDVVEQTREFLRDLRRDWDGKRILIIAHAANRWALEHLLEGKRLADLVRGEFGWQPGWEFVLPDGWD